jgi:hypothetical protein
MRKLRKIKGLALNRETLANLDHLDEAHLGKVAAASAPNGCTASTCLNPHCTCPV